MQTMITIALVFIFRLNVFIYLFIFVFVMQGTVIDFWNSAHLPTFYLTWCAYHLTYNA